MKKLFLLLTICPILGFSQHHVKGVFSPAKDFKSAILYKTTPTESVYIAHTEVNEDGTFQFTADSTFTKGMYRLVYAVPQEEHNFDIIFNGKEDVEFSFSVDEGVSYTSSTENILSTSYIKSMGMVSQSLSKYFREQSDDTLALASIFKTQKETQASYEEAAKETEIAIQLIKANRPYVPKHFKDVETYIKELKTHYFDHIDFNNETLLSSNFLIDRVFNYVFGMPSNEDQATTFRNNLDEAILAMKNASLITKKTILELMWLQLSEAGFSDVANYISDKYLIEIAETLNDKELEQELLVYKNTSIGSKAADFLIDEEKDTKLSDLTSANQYLIVFWSSSCGHCLEELPNLETFLETLPENELQVIAFGVENFKTIWNKEKVNFPKFNHVLGLGKWNNEIARSYNVLSTPTYFLLDKDKNIIAKPDNFDAFKETFKTQK